MPSPLRLLIAASGLTVVLATVAIGWEIRRFGLSNEATAGRVEREVRAAVSERISDVDDLARRVAAESALVDAAAGDASKLPALFERLRQLAEPVDRHDVAATIYSIGRPAGDYRALAWSDGPGEQNLPSERLSGPPTLFVAPGHAGLRLIRVEPIEQNGSRVAVAVAETVMAAVDRTSAAAERRIATAYGPVTVIEQYASAREDLTPAGGFVIATASGAPLLEVHIDRSLLAAARRDARAAWLAAALVPVPIAIGLLSGWAVAARRRDPRLRAWLKWTLLAVLAVGTSALGLIGLVELSGAPANVRWVILALMAVAIVALAPGHAWWRPRRTRRPGDAPAAFVCEQLAAGIALALALELGARLLNRSITPGTLGGFQSVLFPFAADGLLALAALMLTELAIGWGAASILAVASVRWRDVPRVPVRIVSILLWALPSMALLLWPRSAASTSARAALGAAAAAILFATVAAWVRRDYRRTTQSMRLVLGFAALVAPLVALYPLAASTAERMTRRLIAEQYAPETARHQQVLQLELARAQADIDRLTLLPLVADLPSTDSQPAFLVWSQTNLARSRVISDVELFGRNGTLVSRFAFNLRQYGTQTGQQTRQNTGCRWEVFGENASFGAEERVMLHAERDVCTEAGDVLGGVIVHVAGSNDYQALPFVSSPSPYYDVLGVPDQVAVGRLPDLALAVYGWSQRPIFTAGDATWPVDQATFDRLYASGAPFWASLQAGGRAIEVHFSQDRAGIYALGYRPPMFVDHATRLAEMAALMAVLFIGVQMGALLYAPLVQRRQAPFHVLLYEVRTSFYRKLFLFFVAVAVVPVLIAALAFGGYMTSRFQADVEHEAGTTVAVALRVFQELLAAGDRGTPTDDVMVWIRQVIDQDVNYFEGSELVATSQRDLFDSGLLPTRTPATVYRGVALERRANLVAIDRLGDFEYVVAAAPVPSRGSDAILTVPLAPRQRELARELDTLNQRVLVGAVLVVLLAAVLGAWLAGRVADPVARLTKATRQIAAGRLNVRIAADTADELRTLVDDFNSMAETLVAQRAELARTNQLKAWNEMARQVAHEIKNPLTPVQLAAEHLHQVHADAGRPLGAILDQCVQTILGQVKLLRQIASEFANFAGEPRSRPEAVAPAALMESIVDPYRLGVANRIAFELAFPADVPPVWADRTLLARALTNVVENAVQATPAGGAIRVDAEASGGTLTLTVRDTGPGMTPDALARAFEPYFSTKTGGSGLGLANAKRNIEREGGTIAIASAPGAGTTVTVTLPLAAAPRDGGAPGPAPSR